MRTALVALLLISFGAVMLSAVPAGVVYTEGEADIRFKNGSQRNAAIGDSLNTGDTLKTGADGLVELDQKGARVNIASNTVFTLMEKEKGGKTAGVFSVVLGSVKVRYDRLTGLEPAIQTNACVAGARGTEFSVFAGVDGSALIVVEKGAVTVEAEGRSVDLEPEEGVEVRPGQAPSDKFRVPRERIDYRQWNEEKLQQMMADPVAAIRSVSSQLETYIAEIEEYDSLFNEYYQRLQQERRTRAEIAEKQGVEQARKYEGEVVFPLSLQTGNLFLNRRYYSLAALSLRRFIGGRMYMILKSRYILNASDETYGQFRSEFDALLQRFEAVVVPWLVEADI
jgi:hypothetical protein